MSQHASQLLPSGEQLETPACTAHGCLLGVVELLLQLSYSWSVRCLLRVTGQQPPPWRPLRKVASTPGNQDFEHCVETIHQHEITKMCTLASAITLPTLLHENAVEGRVVDVSNSLMFPLCRFGLTCNES